MTSNSRTSTNKVKEDFIAIAPLPIVTKHGHEKTQNEGQILPSRLRGSAERVNERPHMRGCRNGAENKFAVPVSPQSLCVLGPALTGQAPEALNQSAALLLMDPL